MRQKIDPKIFVVVVVALVAILGFWFYKSAQVPVAKLPKDSTDYLAKPDSAQHRRGMMESMERAHEAQASGFGTQSGAPGMRSGMPMMRSAPPRSGAPNSPAGGGN